MLAVSSVTQPAGDLDHVRGGRDVHEIQLTDLGDVVEHGRQLARHRLDLLLAQSQARQARHVQNLVAVNH